MFLKIFQILQILFKNAQGLPELGVTQGRVRGHHFRITTVISTNLKNILKYLLAV